MKSSRWQKRHQEGRAQVASDMLPTMPDDALAALSESHPADSKKFNDDLMELLDSSPSDTPDTSLHWIAQDNTAGTADDADTGSGRAPAAFPG